MPNYLARLITQIYGIQRTFVSQSLDFSNFPKVKKFLDKISYSNLCEISDVNYLPGYSLRCPTVSKGVLTKGLYSSIINFLEDINTILIAYPTTSNLTLAERMTYLGNPFFTANSGITYYLDSMVIQFLVYFAQDFTSMI